MKELLTDSEKEAFEKYIDFKLPNGFRKEDFEFIKMQNPGVAEYPFFLRVRIRDYVKIFDVGYGDLKGMALGQTYTWKELGLYEETLNEGILNNKEKEYLSAVIKPFRNEILTIEKAYFKEDEWLYFTMNRGDFTLPYFKTGTMYQGMEKGKKYTLEDLGL